METTIKSSSAQVVTQLPNNPVCRVCGQSFSIGQDEVDFLARISPTFAGKKFQIPLPTDCPDCRLQLRTMHRNEQYLYKTKSAFSGAQLITLYAPNTPWSGQYKIVSNDEWWSDSWDGANYGRDFDFNRGFFEQFRELDLQIPRLNLITVENENSPYTTGTGYCKNCHIINCSENCEDCYYGKLIQTSKDVMDSSYVYDSELLYECFNVRKCYNCIYLSYSQNCNDCFFSENLAGCKNCLLCTDLHNKEYHILNKPVSREEFNTVMNKVFGSHEQFENAKKELETLKKNRIYKYANVVNCEASTGDFLNNCKNCNECYDVNDSLDCKYVTVGVNVKDNYDCSNMYIKPELSYQVVSTIGTYNIHFCFCVFHSQNIWYSQFCYNSKNLFGCAGLRNKQYCIFNKQYTKDEYEKKVAEIIEHMMKTGEWGYFFPASLSPYGYNETVAQEYLPLTRDEALAKGFNWKDPDEKNILAQTYLIPNSIEDVNDNILNETLVCGTCNRNFKVIHQELVRLRKMKLPVPRNCPDCRHLLRLQKRNRRKLWDRKCSKCGADVKSTFKPDDSRTIYCEKCYQDAVY